MSILRDGNGRGILEQMARRAMRERWLTGGKSAISFKAAKAIDRPVSRRNITDTDDSPPCSGSVALNDNV
jgi:hypothetical protein